MALHIAHDSYCDDCTRHYAVYFEGNCANCASMSAQVMDRDAKLMRQEGPTIFSQAKHNVGIAEIADLILKAHKEQTRSPSS